jgi:dihydroflavonol-4-reductase
VRVLVTGGTGFVGSHTVKALLDGGHEVRLLVRDAARIAPALEPLGAGPVDHVVGDVTDSDSVRRALDGCDAVVHGASVYSNDPRRGKEIRATNMAGARTVLGLAVDKGLDPIVHISSYVALVEEGRKVISEETPPGRSKWPYTSSKAEQEAYARELQEAGAPVVITNPGSVWGPHDPHDGESVVLARRMVRGMIPFVPTTGGVPIVHVGDVAAAHAAVMEQGRGARRYMLAGPYMPVKDLIRLVQEAAGVRRPRIPTPLAMAYGSAVAAGAIQRILPFRLPIEPGPIWLTRCDPRPDNSRAERELGITFRPAEETIREQVEWQKAAGRL